MGWLWPTAEVESRGGESPHKVPCCPRASTPEAAVHVDLRGVPQWQHLTDSVEKRDVEIALNRFDAWV
jgi:hypothetical protein